jgi:streptogramin lyase
LRQLIALAALLTALVLLGGKLSAPVRAQQAPAEAASSTAPRAIVIASSARLTDIRGIAVDAGGNVFISSEVSPAPAQCIARSVAAHVSVTLFSNCATVPAEDPSGIAATRDGSSVYLANRTQNSIRLLDMITGKVSIEPGGSASNAKASQFTLAAPAGLAKDAAGNLYVADRGNNRVLRLAPGGGDFASLAQVLDAAAVATDPTGQEIFAVSPSANRVFRIDPQTSDIAAFAGTGTTPETPEESTAQFPAPVTAAQAVLAAPEGIAVDGAGNVFLSDTDANAILRVDAKTNLLSRVALGSELNSPGALAIDRRGNLIVADRGNHRVVEFAGVAAPQQPASVTITPAPFDYGDEPTGGTIPQTFVLTNGSSSALSLTTNDFSFTGNDPLDFMQTNNCVPQLAAGSTCQIFVTFSPLGTGARAGTLMVTDSDSSSPQTASLTGTGDTFALTAANQAATMATVVPGDPGNYSLSVTPDSVFAGNVTLTCPIKLPDATLTCTINPPQIMIAAGVASPFAVTITTQSGKTPATVTLPSSPRGFRPGSPALFAFFLACVLAFTGPLMWTKKRKERVFAGVMRNSRQLRRAWAISALAFLCVAGVAGCYHAPARYIPATLPGIYNIDILGTAQNASRPITITLNVE